MLLHVSFGQTIVGDWKLTNHIANYNNSKNYDCAKLFGLYKIHVDKNGTYETVSAYKGVKSTTFGKWKITKGNKKLTLYNNDFKPKDNPGDSVADRTYDIIKISDKEFQIKENLCTEGEEGLSTYTRQK